MQTRSTHPGNGSSPILGHFRRFSLALLAVLFLAAISPGQTPPSKRVLILFEGSDVPANLGRGDARELAMLLGHFNVSYQLKGMDSYSRGEVDTFDLTFFIGYSKRYD